MLLANIQAILNWIDIAKLPLLIGMIIAVTAIIMSASRARSLDRLKQSLVDRGMSPEEVERVVKARPKD